jgi:hypothetical protein
VDLDTLKSKIQKNIVFVVRLKDAQGNYNYAKILVKKSANGEWLVAAPNGDRCIEVQVSYQLKQNVAYAKKPF